MVRQILTWLQMIEHQGGEVLNEALLYYISKAGTSSDWQRFSDLIQKTLPNSGEKVMNAFEQHVAEEKAKGIEQGFEKGARQNTLALAKRMLDSSIPVDDVAKITALPLSTLRALQRKAELIF